MDLKCKGNYIGAVREYKKVKQEMLALDAGISRSMLSKIENGSEVASSELISLLFDKLEIDEKEYELNKKWMYEQFIAISKASIYDNPIYETIFSEFKEEVKRNLCLKFYTEYRLIKLIYSMKCDFPSVANLLNELERYQSYFDDYELAIYEDYKSIQAMFNEEYDLSLDILNSINRSKLPDYLNGMIEYHIATNYHFKKNNFIAIKHYERAIEYFTSSQNFRKILYGYSNLCDVYYKIGNLPLAIETAQNCINSASNVISEPKLISDLYHNISWLYIIVNEYKNAIYNAEKSLTMFSDRVDIYFYLAFSYFQLGNIEKALYYISKIENINDTDTIDYKMCIALKKVIQKLNDRIFYLTDFYKMINDIQNPIYKQLILEFIIKYYEEIEDYKNMAIYSMKLNKLLSNRLMIIGEYDE